MIRNKIIAEAKTHVGTSYSKMDCSKLVQTVMKKLGDNDFPRVSATQGKYLYDKGLTQNIDKSESKTSIAKKLNVGDLIFWGNPKYPNRWKEIHHVAIWAGDGKTVESTGSGNGVHIGNIWESSSWQIVLIADVTSLLSSEGEEEEMIRYTPGMDFDAETKEYQLSLIALGYFLPEWGADGKFGEETRTAHWAFQVAAGLSKTDCVDVETQAAVFKSLRDRAGNDADAAEKLKAYKAWAAGVKAAVNMKY